MKKNRIFLSVLFMISLTSCVTPRKNVHVSEGFMSQHGSILIITLPHEEHANFYTLGNQGILDYYVNNAMADNVGKKIKSIPISPFLDYDYYEPYNIVFGKNFQVKIAKEPINIKDLKGFSKDIKFAPYDFRYLKNKYNTDYALILNVTSFGAARQYYSFIPTSSPYGVCDENIYLVNLNNNTIIAEHHSLFTKAAQGYWDSPPDYTALVDAVEGAVEGCLDQTRAIYQ